MPRIKSTKIVHKLNFENQNYFCDSKYDSYDNTLQNPENSSAILQRDQTCDTASGQLEIKSNSESPQNNNHFGIHGNSNKHLQWDQTSETSNNRFDTEAVSEITEYSVTDFHENSNEQIQWKRIGETANTEFEPGTDSISETIKNNLANSHENSNEQMQWTENCETSNDKFETETDSMPTQNNHTKLHSNLDHETECTETQDSITNFQTENCLIHKDANDLSYNSEKFQRNQDHEPNILLDIKIEPPDHDSSNSEEYQNYQSDSHQEQNHISDSFMKDVSKIKTENCDIDYKKHSQSANVFQIKSEPCDKNSDPLGSECSAEIKSHSESSHEDCDHSSSSSTVEVKSEKPDPENDAASPPSPDLKRSRRNSKRKRGEVEDRCPVCGLTVRYSDLESHFAKEVENLSNIAKNVKKNRLSVRDREDCKCCDNLDFIQVKYNRENRLTARVAKYANKQGTSCPVCQMRIFGTDQEINDHVLGCFVEDDDSDINVTDCDETFEEYEIGNETRIRAISLVPGGHSALQGYSSKSKSKDDEDDGVDVNVDIDDTEAFGEPQYTELDVIHNKNGASNEKEEQLRRAVVSNPTAEPHIIEGKKWSTDCDIQKDIDEIVGSYAKNNLNNQKSKEENEDVKVEDNSKKDENFQNPESRIISSLKERLKDLEQQKNVKCLICLEPYTRPLVSTTCWHVHCEECWLVSMGVKKLCPQCNMIVFPTDLRRIYL